jgi:hypothetical protein
MYAIPVEQPSCQHGKWLPFVLFFKKIWINVIDNEATGPP